MFLFQSVQRKWLFFILLVVIWSKIEIKQFLFWLFVWELQVLMAWVKPRFIQVCAVVCLFAHSCPTLQDPMDCSLPGSSVHGHSPGKKNRMSCLALLPGGLPNPGMEPRSPTLQADSLPSEPAGKPKNTREGNLSLLQGIYLTQASNWGLLHCRWILYQLRYLGSYSGILSLKCLLGFQRTSFWIKDSKALGDTPR